jgi:hypothetical protein
MYVKIRADLFNAALHAAARSGRTGLRHGLIFPDQINDHYSFRDIVAVVPVVEQMLDRYIASGDSDANPACEFFSIDPPGMWLKLTRLVGPNADYMDTFLDSEEALGIVLNQFLPVLKGFQHEWYERARIDP